MYRILVCDDEKDIVSALRIYLRAEGYEVSEAANGEEALARLSEEEIDLVLLDVMMPVLDGISAMERIREMSNVPIILLTAKSEEKDKILGLTQGADDYVTKPFNPMELYARIRSQLRRYTRLGGKTDSGADTRLAAAGGQSGNTADDRLYLAGLELCDRRKEVLLDGEPLSLTPTEYDILHFLMQHPGDVFSPREIYRAVWNEDILDPENTVAVHIRHLREKIEIDPGNPRCLKVVWGRGYKLEDSRM